LLPWALRKRKDLQLDPRTLARNVTSFARLVLCSGSYVLCDLEVMEGKDRVGIKVRLV